MTAAELTGHAIIQANEGMRVMATAIFNALFRWNRHMPDGTSLTGASFTEQEPDLVKESQRPR